MHLITLFMCGDVMTGRGVDQILSHPSHPHLHEFYTRDARGYVPLAEEAHGQIQKPVDYDYIWGDALETLEQAAPDVRLINLETSITTSNHYWPNKRIHYRMHPENIACLTTAKIDVCTLANNHVLDWGYIGLTETLATLKQVQVKTVGAGQTLLQAMTPAILNLAGNGRVLVFAVGFTNSGIPTDWAAREHRPGVNLLEDFSEQTIQTIQSQVQQVKQPGDIAVASIHWGSNWGYKIPQPHIWLAHQLIDRAGVDVIHGHSSHHAKAIEVYKNKLILYGCGDFLNDYEGISGYEWFRGDLSCMYFATVNATTGQLVALRIVPNQIKRFQLHQACQSDIFWLKDNLNQQGTPFGTHLAIDGMTLVLKTTYTSS